MEAELAAPLCVALVCTRQQECSPKPAESSSQGRERVLLSPSLPQARRERVCPSWVTGSSMSRAGRAGPRRTA